MILNTYENFASKDRTSDLDTVSTGSDSDLVSDQHATPIVDQVAIAPCTDCVQD